MLPVVPMARGQRLSCRTVRKGWADLDMLTPRVPATRFYLSVCSQVPLSKTTEVKTVSCVCDHGPRHLTAGAKCTGLHFPPAHRPSTQAADADHRGL